jgi:hypothetical protein
MIRARLRNQGPRHDQSDAPRSWCRSTVKPEDHGQAAAPRSSCGFMIGAPHHDRVAVGGGPVGIGCGVIRDSPFGRVVVSGQGAGPFY